MKRPSSLGNACVVEATVSMMTHFSGHEITESIRYG